jgi:hypothetical protein
MPAGRGHHGAFAAGGNYKATKNGYGGGDKLSGTGYSGVGIRGTIARLLKNEAVPTAARRNLIFAATNQVGGIGAGRSIFAASGFPGTGGVARVATYSFEFKR